MVIIPWSLRNTAGTTGRTWKNGSGNCACSAINSNLPCPILLPEDIGARRRAHISFFVASTDSDLHVGNPVDFRLKENQRRPSLPILDLNFCPMAGGCFSDRWFVMSEPFHEPIRRINLFVADHDRQTVCMRPGLLSGQIVVEQVAKHCFPNVVLLGLAICIRGAGE